MSSDLNKITGALYGMAIGDAMGMPSELWPREKVKRFFGEPITFFQDGPSENEIGCNYKAGQYTDDTGQALVIIQTVLRSQGKVTQKEIAHNLLDWAEKENAFENNILGPSSKASLEAWKKGLDPKPFTTKAETNGAAMRIAPIGCVYSTKKMGQLISLVHYVSAVTHETDVTISGAAMVAACVSAGIDGLSWDEMLEQAYLAHDQAIKLGAATYAASNKYRLQEAIGWIRNGVDSNNLEERLYHIIGTGVSTSESVPSAIAIAYFTKDPIACARFCANLGGDTDTIGAIATAICGAMVGFAQIDSKYIQKIDEANAVNLQQIALQLSQIRDTFDLL